MMTDSDLAGEQRYYWAARAIDESGNTGPLSTVVTAETQHIAPAPISDLSASDTGLYETTLTWTATGDDGTTGTAASYEMRYSTQAMTSVNFADATEVTNIPTPLSAGNEQSVTVTDLEAGTLYRFAILARDETGAASYLSNVALVSTDPEPDITPPAAVSDLSAEVPQTGGQPLTGSAVEWSSEQPPDFTAQALLDGSNSTMWSSAARSVSREESIRFDLGTPTPTDRLKIWPADGYADLFPPAVEIRVSPDGLEWTTVLAESDYVAAPGTPLEATFPVVPVRQVEFIAYELAREDNGYYYAVAAELEMLTAESEPGTIVVSWTAPGDDGEEGRAAEYDLRIGSC
ncbi:MAG: hypothetical protein GY842_27500, partial [bacterium]|nr:hypothetical protein [bacterium]